MDTEAWSRHLDWAEDRRPFPYEDSVGKLTIGVGRNIDERGITDDEMDYLKDNDMALVLDEAETLPYWGKLNPARQLVVADMIFNLGFPKFRGFVRTNRALQSHDYDEAAREMVDSKWYRQTGRRARRLVEAMRSGVWLD